MTMLLFHGKAAQVWSVLSDLAARQGKMTMREYFELAWANGGK